MFIFCTTIVPDVTRSVTLAVHREHEHGVMANARYTPTSAETGIYRRRLLKSTQYQDSK